MDGMHIFLTVGLVFGLIYFIIYYVKDADKTALVGAISTVLFLVIYLAEPFIGSGYIKVGPTLGNLIYYAGYVFVGIVIICALKYAR